jgi:hypothetical protein
MNYPCKNIGDGLTQDYRPKPPKEPFREKMKKTVENFKKIVNFCLGAIGLLLSLAILIWIASLLGPTGIIIVLLVLILLKIS